MDTISIVKEYLDSSLSDRALLITAAWGSGKTYFWKESIVPLVEERGQKPVYVSLNGISNVQQLESQILLQVLPEKMRTKLVFNTLNIFTRRILKTEFSELSGSLRPKNFTNCVICYDDLERCDPFLLKEVWGFINQDIEKLGIKTIVLTDDSKLDDQFDKIREKNVGQILKYQADVNAILKSIVNSYENIDQEYYKLIESNFDFISGLVQKFSIENFRTIKSFFENLRVVFKYSHEAKRSYHKVILFVLIFTSELALGMISPKSFKKIKEVEMEGEEFRILNMLKESTSENQGDNDTPRNYWEELSNRYLNKIDVSNYSFFKGICEYILTGVIDENQIQEETDLEETELLKMPQNILALKYLMGPDFRLLHDKTFKEYLEIVIESTKKGEYNTYDYNTIATNLPFYQAEGLLDLSKKELKEIVLEGVKLSAANFSRSEYVWQNINAFRADNDLAKEVRKEIKKIHSQSLVDEQQARIDEIVGFIKDENGNGVASILDEYYFKPLFNQTSNDELVQSMCNASNPVLYQIDRKLNDRYIQGSAHTTYVREADDIKKIAAGLTESLKKFDKKSVKGYLIRSITQTLNQSLEEPKVV